MGGVGQAFSLTRRTLIRAGGTSIVAWRGFVSLERTDVLTDGLEIRPTIPSKQPVVPVERGDAVGLGHRGVVEYRRAPLADARGRRHAADRTSRQPAPAGSL